jgi:D-glycero-D-manno-heptose 1,7-bisphosphate phosphatase
MIMRKAVFLDRDGVINRNLPTYVGSWEEFVFLDGAVDALRRLAHTDMAVIVASNQSAINRGLTGREKVDEVNARMVSAVARQGGRIDAVLYCPHRPDEGCNCRKPKPGLLLEAAERFDIDLRRSYFIGDAVSDVEAALAVGAQPLLVLTGRGREQAPLLARHGYRGVPVLKDLGEAVAWIVEREKEKSGRRHPRQGTLGRGSLPGL